MDPKKIAEMSDAEFAQHLSEQHEKLERIEAGIAELKALLEELVAPVREAKDLEDARHERRYGGGR